MFSGVVFIKKLFVIMSILLLGGCSEPASPEKISDTDFKSEITLDISGKSYEGSIVKSGDFLEMTVSGGELALPLGFSIADNGFCFSSGEREYRVPIAKAPAGAIIEIKNALDSLPLGDIENQKDEIIVKAPFGRLKIDRKTGDYLSLSTQSCEVAFGRFEKLSAKSE